MIHYRRGTARRAWKAQLSIMNYISRDSVALSSMTPEEIAGVLHHRILSLPIRNTPSVRSVRRDFSRLLRNTDASLMLEIARVILTSGEHRWVAYELIHEHPEAMKRIGESELEELGRGINSWWSVDPFSLELAGPAWREGQVSDELIHRWARSPDRWWRRAALVSTVPLNAAARGGRGDPPRTLSMCEMLVADRDDMVVKALSWALRALVPRDRRAVSEFLRTHGSVVAARVVREVTNKLDTDLKNPRRRPLQ
jgi:3-methyladenine DNA glycosylase AlkD